ncbi:MAG: hypothetical protein ACOCZH_01680 [Phototrophicaceae bacterium]
MKLRMILLLLLVLALGLAACGGDSDPTNTPPPAASENGEADASDADASDADASENGEADASDADEEPAASAATGSQSYSADLLAVDSMMKLVLAPRGADPLYNRITDISLVDDTVRIEGVRRISGENLSMVLEQTLTIEDGELVSNLTASGDAGVESDDPRVTDLNDIMVRSYIRMLPEVDSEIIFVTVDITDEAVEFTYDLE